MPKKRICLPLDIGDYLRDTIHLSAQQNGAYISLIMQYFLSASPLPNDDEILSRITKLSLSEWRKERETLCNFFVIKNEAWWHNRLEFELNKSQAILKRNAENGKKGGRPRKDNVVKITQK